MRRILSLLPASLAVLMLTAAPALADVGARPEAGTRGSFTGVVLALLLGLAFAVAIVYFVYQETQFGADSAHHEEAHDIRDGVADHEINA